MADLKELKQKRELLNKKIEATFSNMDMIIQENYRVADIAHNASFILDDLDKEFEKKTGLNGTDISFLFIATALQTLRWILQPSLGDTINSNERIGDKEGDKSVKQSKKDYSDNHKNWDMNKSSKGYKTWKEIVFSSVPYDATKGAPYFEVNMEGKYHRYKTLGHDPLLGWIFGTVNIITDTITLSNFKTFKVENMHFSEETNIINALGNTFDSIFEDFHRLPAAIFRQGLHLKSDGFTKLGLPVPVIEVFSKELAGKLYRSQYDALCLSKDLKKIGKSAMYAIFVNMIISLVHGLFYDDSKYLSREIYEVKTRKILSYSNAIASGSNVIGIAISTCLGNKSALKKLDVGGIMVTLYRLINDYNFIRRVKEEFVFGSFDKLIQGEEYEFQEV